MTKWEYDFIPVECGSINRHILRNVLEKAGNKGWELVSVSEGWAYLKRPHGQALSDAQDALSLERAQKIND